MDPYVQWLHAREPRNLFQAAGTWWRTYQKAVVQASLKPARVKLQKSEARDLLHKSGGAIRPIFYANLRRAHGVLVHGMPKIRFPRDLQESAQSNPACIQELRSEKDYGGLACQKRLRVLRSGVHAPWPGSVPDAGEVSKRLHRGCKRTI